MSWSRTSSEVIGGAADREASSGGSRMSKYCWGGNRSLQSPAALGFIGVKDVVKTGCTLSKRRVVLRESSLRRLGAQAP